MADRENTLHQLRAWSGGDLVAGEELFARLYDELRAVAGTRLRASPASRLETTELVHEAFLKLVDQNRVEWQDRSQFFAIAARVMRRILIDAARARVAEKRGGGSSPLSLDDASQTTSGLLALAESNDPSELLALDAALVELHGLDPETARIVELRFFVGLSLEETAEVVGQSRATVVRRWRVAKGWLHQHLGGESTR